jgi:hypothetical protein
MNVHLQGAFMLSVDGATICGKSSASFARAIHMENDTLHVRGGYLSELARQFST